MIMTGDSNLAATLHDGATLSPLPPTLSHALPVVGTFALLSLVSASSLFLILFYQLFFKWRKSPRGVQLQLYYLILNLLFADIQQSLCFVFNLKWSALDKVDVESSMCWAQAWFGSVGDLASGVWSFSIGVHTFVSLALNYKISPLAFTCWIIVNWMLVYIASLVPIAMHPHHLYVRAGAWCWINAEYEGLRLYSHYLYIMLAEFGSVVLYATLFVTLHYRIKRGHSLSHSARHLKRISHLMVIYPAVYVVCTLPLVYARVASFMGHPVGYTHFCLGGALITSNGWIDVLVYFLTRRVLLFGDAPEIRIQAQPADQAIDTFQSTFPLSKNKNRLGTVTTIEATRSGSVFNHGSRVGLGGLQFSTMRGKESLELFFARGGKPQETSFWRQLRRKGSKDSLSVKLETTVTVHSEPADSATSRIARERRPSQETDVERGETHVEGETDVEREETRIDGEKLDHKDSKS
ncbi:hypothetical protein IWZ03DRAFT_211387 [Phyllosticta citriasiana]|uniref:G protein-coupled receptor GPR1/2/3 C-terminal domain-containing protein n=1 Tax=Phyllosticta citriasiana TaxID=595635 RepID=A0ABR1KLI2_9PEZI